jgi:hypothetical protein
MPLPSTDLTDATDPTGRASAPAPDRAPGADVPSRSTPMQLRRVLHAYREGWPPEAPLAAAARMVADDARQQQLSAPRMLVALKERWASLEEVGCLPPRDARALLDRLVSLSIAAYFPAPAARWQPVADLDRSDDACTAA